ncbi:MAG: SPOR domain-containing protein [Novosphingobium sp.]
MAIALAAAPAAADVKAGVDAWSRGDFPAAVGAWQGPAAQGDADAQFNLGQAYRLGRGVNADMVKAEELFSKAAAQGHINASDYYGLLLFQRGERAKALPFISAAADRGEPRAQYLLGIANFNGDNVPKDWVRAYALVSLAQQAGLSQAISALSQMDQYIPLDQRQKSVALAQELSAQAESTRARVMAAAELGNSLPSEPSAPVVTATARAPVAVAVAAPARPIASHSGDAGADYARPRPIAPVAATPALRRPVVVAPAAAVRPPSPKPASAPVPPRFAVPMPPSATSGAWRVQFGAFGVTANAEAMWDRLKGRAELAGHTKLLVPAGAVRKLQAGGFANQTAARSACARLSVAGFTCLVVSN